MQIINTSVLYSNIKTHLPPHLFKRKMYISRIILKTVTMKNVTTLLLIVFISSYYNAQEVRVTGEIINPTTDSVSLYYYKDRDRVTLSAAALDNGKFEMKFHLDSAMMLNFYDGNEVAAIVLQPNDDLHLLLNTKLFDETLVFSGKGANLNNMLNKLFLIDEVLNDKVTQLAEDENTEEEDLKALITDNHNMFIDIVKDYIVAEDLIHLGYGSLIESDSVILDRKINMYTRQLAFNKAIKSLLNTEAVDIVGTDLEGAETSLSEYKGQTIVLDFWATWCGPCKAEMPALQELEKKYGNDIAFVSVGVFCEEEGWVKMAKDFDLKKNIFLTRDNMEQIKDYQVYFIPRYMVIDENFKIIDAHAPTPSSGDLIKYF